MKHSIRTQITSLTLAAILVCIVMIGGISIFSIKREGDSNSAEKMTLICENRCKILNEYLNSIEQSVDMVGRYAGEDLDSVELMEGGVIGAKGTGKSLGLRTGEQHERMDRYLQAHSDKMEMAFRSVANHTNGVLTYYYRFNPELSDTVKGFWFSRNNSSEFVPMEPTEIPNFDQDDSDRVGWYYIPLRHGRPTWLNPYVNENMGTKIISYVIPIFKAGTFIGIVGMDIGYDTLVSQIQNIKVYDTGYAWLSDDEGTVVYHPTLESGTKLSDVDEVFTTMETVMERAESSAEPLRYRYEGEERMMVYTTLANGMRLVVSAPAQEINANWLVLINNLLMASLIILAVFVGAAMLMVQRITNPLQRLTAASRLLAEGNYDVDLPNSGDDEVGILTIAFQQLIDHLRVYISDLNSKAYQDAMTGVKNKGAFNASAKKLNDSIRMSAEGASVPEFALVMLDCNNLKHINDQYGHEKGDSYLKTACALICQIYGHSPVFRMGGDEFVVLLQRNDYEDREELMERFDREAEEINASVQEPWECVNIAKGMASYDERYDMDVESVLHRADKRMYLDKKRMKAARR